MTDYKFKGYDWLELAECWGIETKPRIPDWLYQLHDEDEEIEGFPEEAEIKFKVGGSTIRVSTNIEEEVLTEKIIKHITRTLARNVDNDASKQMRADINRFLDALIEEEFGYSVGMYQALKEIECNHTLAQWIIRHLESLWT